jgi:hypothetical protein
VEFEFPFDVPADLTALSAEEFAAFATQARTAAREALSADSTPAPALIAYRDLMTGLGTEETRRTEEAAQEAAQASAARAELATLTADPAPVATDPAPAPVTEPVTDPAPVAPVTASTGRPASTLDTPPVPERQRVGSLVAAADAPTRSAGELTSFAEVGRLLDTQFSRYGRPGANARGRAPLIKGGSRFAMGGRSMTRHNIAMIQRDYPAEFRITDPSKAHEVLEHVRNEARLPGGSLAASMLLNVEAGKSLTAAAGWCAPSEILYDLCSLSSLDGMLDIPTIQASRGGFQIPEDGGPDFATIYDLIGDEGDVILTEYQVENGAEKVCVEIPCPDFDDVRLDVAYLCITGALLQQRGYPEAVTHFTQEAITALAHKVNASMIARLVAGSTAPVTIVEPGSSDDAASNLLAAVELAIMDQRYRHRRPLSATSEVVFPAWVLGPIRASMARRQGVAEMAVTDAEIMNWFAIRGARPQFVYDWQDAFTGGAFGGSASATAFPTTVTFMVYPAGTWVKAEQDVINLDTVYDNAMLTQNQFTALFVEDGLAALKMCRDSRLYTTDVIPNGVVAARTLSA